MKLATYYYSHAATVYPRPVFNQFKMRVEILAETEKKFQIRFMEFHADKRPPNTTAWVRRRKVRPDEVTPATPREIGDIRLPYKD